MDSVQASMIEHRLIEHFAAVVRHGSFKAAAEAQAVSQSTMTKDIAKLERRLRLRLFNRTTRTVEPTDTARRLLISADSVLRSMSAFEDEARLLAGGDIGALRVGAIALATELFVPDTLAYLAEVHPDLEVDVVVGSVDVYHDLVTGVCDVAVGDEANFLESPHAQVLRMTPVRRAPVALVHRQGHPCAHNYADLVQYPLAIPSRYYNENSLFHAFRRQGGPPEPRYRLNNLSTCLGLVARSDVITLAPASVVESGVQGLQTTALQQDLDIQLVMVTVAAHRLTPAIRVFESALLRG